MVKSVRFRTLTRELSRLKKQFLPKINPTGLYSERQLVRTLAYRVLAHAEIESYLEDRAWEVVINTKQAWDNNGETRLTLLTLIAFSDVTMSKPPDTLTHTTGSRIEHLKRLEIGKKIDAAITSFRWVIDNNHGIKEANILALLLPIGIRSHDLDPVWLATMNTFGKNRGVVAHTSATSYRTIQPPDPATELNTIKQITQELLRVDELINNLMR